MRTTKELERGVQLIETTSGYRLISVKQRKLELSPHKVNSFVFFFFLRHCLLSFKCLLRFNSLLSFFIGLQKLKATQLLDMFSVTRVTARGTRLARESSYASQRFPMLHPFSEGPKKITTVTSSRQEINVMKRTAVAIRTINLNYEPPDRVTRTKREDVHCTRGFDYQA